MLKGKVILVTGASKGIGAETARVLARHGATVVINYNTDAAGAKKVLKDVVRYAPRSKAIRADVAKKGDVDTMMKKIIAGLGRIDGVVNNASGPLSFKPLSDLARSDFTKHIDVILIGAFNVIRCALPHMLRSKEGKIVNILSSVTLGAPPSKPLDYIAAKFALLGFSKALAADLGPSGITVNCVSPGMAETDMSAVFPAKMKEMVAYQTPLKRLARPADVAGVVAFLCSDASDYITGANIPVCGGSVM